MFRVPKSAYSFATSSVQGFMTPTNEGVEAPPPLPVARGKDQFTEDYYCGEMVIFEVEDVFFRVPKCLFEPGPGKFKPLLFREDDEDPDEDIIPLPDLMADEFRALIDFFLPYRCLNRKEPSLQYWVNLLSISTKYHLELIRPIAIKGIDAYRPEIDPVEKYALAVKYMVDGWKDSSFKMLCDRPAPLTIPEAGKLGVAIVTQIFTKREKALSRSHTSGERTAGSPQPSIESASLPRGLITAPDSVPSSSTISQPDLLPAAYVATTTTKSIADSTAVTHTPPDNVIKVKFEPSEEQNTFSNSQPVSNQPNNGHTTNSGNLLAQAPRLFPPPPPGAFIIPQGQGHPLFSGVITSDSLFTTKPTETQKAPKESTLPTSASQSKFTFKQ